MPWSAIEITDVMDELSPQEQAAFNAVQGASTTQSNILTRVVNSVRGYCKAGGNQLDAAGTIPDQLRNEVIDIVIWRWLKKFPALKALQTKERQATFDSAMALLKEVAGGKPKIELPAAPDVTAAPAGGIQLASSARRQFTRRRTRGL